MIVLLSKKAPAVVELPCRTRRPLAVVPTQKDREQRTYLAWALGVEIESQTSLLVRQSGRRDRYVAALRGRLAKLRRQEEGAK